MKVEITFSNIKNYIEGNIRYSLYYSKYFKWLLRDHIVEQIEYRINSMRQNCYTMGQCEMCGCSTTALQMCSKPCEGHCYPSMLFFKIDWDHAKEIGYFEDFEIDINTKKFNLICGSKL